MQIHPTQAATGSATSAVVRVEAVEAVDDGRSPSSATAGTGTDAAAAAGTAGGSVDAVDRTVAPATSLASASMATEASSDVAAPARSRSREPQFQLRVATAQQARDFLELTAAQLQTLKATLSARLSGLRSQDAQLQGQLSTVAATWRTRLAATGGSVDAQLRFSGGTPAMQRFSVRGLDLRSLRSGGAETLSISFTRAATSSSASSTGISPAMNSGTAATASVDIDPLQPGKEIVRRFDRSLAPLGMSVDADASGALIFSVAESTWPAVQDSLAVKGNGIRFPAGQPTRARTDAEPPAMQPQEWTAQDATALRHALAEVTQALDRVQQARASVERALAEASRQVDAAQAPDLGTASALAEAFVSTTSQPGYQALSSVSGALAGTSRSRVATLLALPDGH